MFSANSSEPRARAPLLRSAPDSTLAQVHAEAFARLSPAQRDFMFDTFVARAKRISDWPSDPSRSLSPRSPRKPNEPIPEPWRECLVSRDPVSTSEALEACPTTSTEPVRPQLSQTLASCPDSKRTQSLRPLVPQGPSLGWGSLLVNFSKDVGSLSCDQINWRPDSHGL